MKDFTTSEFRANTAKAFNEVQENGMIKIVSRSRPDMILMTVKKLDQIKGWLEK